MSLTTFIRAPEVAAQMRPLVPCASRVIPEPLRVPPRTTHFSVVGTAFDYLLRFEIQRRAPHASPRRWVADLAVEHLDKGRPLRILKEWQTAINEKYKCNGMTGKFPDLGQRARTALERAKQVVSNFVAKKKVSRRNYHDVARQALRLAQLDPFFRAGYLDLRFDDDPDPNDVQDLLAMLGIVPFKLLVHEDVVLLNPTFGSSGALVGGADADLITGSSIIDVKVRKAGTWGPRDFMQLIGYLILGRQERRARRPFPRLDCIGIYFARHGYLWTHDVRVMLRTKKFREIEDWFLKRARRGYIIYKRKGP